MKCWSDLSWREKCKIEEGDANELSYLSGYSFQVKCKVQEGKEKKEKDKEKQ